MESEKIQDMKSEKGELNTFQLKALEDAEKALDKLREETSTKKYLIEMDQTGIDGLLVFIQELAPWKFTEGLGIIEVEKELITCSKKGKLFISGLAIEAIYYYLSKVEGKGKLVTSNLKVTLETYIGFLTPIMQTLEKVKADSALVSEAEFVVSARREGIDPTSETSGESVDETK